MKVKCGEYNHWQYQLVDVFENWRFIVNSSATILCQSMIWGALKANRIASGKINQREKS